MSSARQTPPCLLHVVFTTLSLPSLKVTELNPPKTEPDRGNRGPRCTPRPACRWPVSSRPPNCPSPAPQGSAEVGCPAWGGSAAPGAGARGGGGCCEQAPVQAGAWGRGSAARGLGCPDFCLTSEKPESPRGSDVQAEAGAGWGPAGGLQSLCDPHQTRGGRCRCRNRTAPCLPAFPCPGQSFSFFPPRNELL